MSIISCPECSNKISDKAPACPQCGAPKAVIHDAPAGAGLTTIQETSKRLKTHIIGSALLFWGGIIWMVTGLNSGADEPPVIATLAVTGGFFWYVATKISIWWHHK